MLIKRFAFSFALNPVLRTYEQIKPLRAGSGYSEQGFCEFQERFSLGLAHTRVDHLLLSFNISPGP